MRKKKRKQLFLSKRNRMVHKELSKPPDKSIRELLILIYTSMLFDARGSGCND